MDTNLFSRIVVGVDASDPSKDAVTYAARLARDHGGRLLLCSAVNWIPVMGDASSAGVITDAQAIIDGLKEEADELLARALDVAKRLGVEAERYDPEGNPPDEILTLAEEHDATLIVMGTHARRGLARMFLGSTTDAVLRGSTIPVLTLRSDPAPGHEADRCLHRVLVAVDDSPPSDAALAAAYALPADDRRDFFVYSVVEIEAPSGLRAAAAYERERRHEAHLTIQRAISSARSHGIEIQGCAVDGRPAEVIVDAARVRNVDLIVVGSHGRRGLRRLFLGSVAEHIVRNAAVPTLVIRTASAEVEADPHALQVPAHV
jgi:nucleotide-binding universal stress UspA family protein